MGLAFALAATGRCTGGTWLPFRVSPPSQVPLAESPCRDYIDLSAGSGCHRQAGGNADAIRSMTVPGSIAISRPGRCLSE